MQDAHRAPIRILYDEWAFQEPYGGVARMFVEVMRHLPSGFKWLLSPVCTSNVYLQEAPFCLPRAKYTFRSFSESIFGGRSFPGARRIYLLLARLFPRFIPAAEVLNSKSRKRIFQEGAFDVYHADAWDWQGVVGRKPIVTTVCDLIPVILDHNENLRRKFESLCTAASHVIAITEHTKRDLVRYCNIPEEKISVVYLGYNMKKDNVVSKGVNGFKETERFVLFVGKRNGYKNFRWMVRVLIPLLKGGLKIFCTGGGFTSDEQMFLREFGVEDAVVQKFVTDEEMQWLFKHAICFIHPSLYEGFGIPILDAFAAGCPAVIANASCFPEVAGDAALYFDPRGDGVDLRAHIENLDVKNGRGKEEVRKSIILKGEKRVCDFSWENCSRQTAEVYRSVWKSWSESHPVV